MCQDLDQRNVDNVVHTTEDNAKNRDVKFYLFVGGGLRISNLPLQTYSLQIVDDAVIFSHGT
jgi:hypothetical protein